jgi:hypothetical protein
MPPASLVFDLLLHVILPALVGSALVLALFLFPDKNGCTAVGAALALVVGVGISNYLREALPWLPEQPEKSGWHWLPAAILASLAVGLLAEIPRVPVAVGWLLRAAAAGLATWLLVPAELRAETRWLAPAFFAVVLADWAALHLSARRAPGSGMPAGLALVFLGGAAVLIHAAFAKAADVALMTTFSLAGIAVVAWWKRADVAAVMPGGAVLLPGLLLAGYSETFSEVPWVSFALVALAPLALVPALLPPVSRLEGWRLRLVQLGLLLVPVIIAVVLAMRAETLEFE